MGAALGLLIGGLGKIASNHAQANFMQRQQTAQFLHQIALARPDMLGDPEFAKFATKSGALTKEEAEFLGNAGQAAVQQGRQFQQELGGAMGGGQAPSVSSQMMARGAPAAAPTQAQDNVAAIQQQIMRLQADAIRAAANPNLKQYLPTINQALSDLRNQRTQYAIDDRQRRYFEHSDLVHEESMQQAERHFQQAQQGTESRFETGKAIQQQEFRQTHPQMEDVISQVPRGQQSDFVDYMRSHPELGVDPKEALKEYAKARTDFQKSQADINASLRMVDQVRRFMDANGMTGDTAANWATGTYRSLAQRYGAPLDPKQRQLADKVSQLDAITMQSYVKGTRFGKQYLDKITTHIPKTGGTYDSIRQQLDDLQEFLSTLKAARTPSDFETTLSSAAPTGTAAPAPAPPPGFK